MSITWDQVAGWGVNFNDHTAEHWTRRHVADVPFFGMSHQDCGLLGRVETGRCLCPGASEAVTTVQRCCAPTGEDQLYCSHCIRYCEELLR